MLTSAITEVNIRDEVSWLMDDLTYYNPSGESVRWRNALNFMKEIGAAHEVDW